MKIAYWYLGKAVLLSSLVALLVIVAVDLVGDMLYHAERAGSDFDFATFLLLSLFDLPHAAFEFMPSGLLIGALLGLGQLASHSEIVAFRSAGMSVRHIAGVTASIGGIVIILTWLGSEILGPIADQYARQVETETQDGSVLYASDESFWMREENRFVRVAQVISPDYFQGITVYQFDQNKNLQWLGIASHAIREQQQWSLFDFKRSFFTEDQVQADHQARVDWEGMQTPVLQTSQLGDPFRMPVKRLMENIEYMQANHMDAFSYHLALYKRLATPLTGIAMLLLALPFILGGHLVGGVGQRLFVGIVAALLVHIISDGIANGGLVYRFPPLLAAFLPSVLLLAGASLAFRINR